MKKIILASKSPYRKELLERLGIPFETSPSDFDEEPLKRKIDDPKTLTQELAKEKAFAVAKNYDENCIIIGSDQVCVLGKEIMGKPGDLERAARQLAFLAGKTHQLITSYCLVHKGEILVKTNVTSLKMRQLSDLQIKNYLRSDNSIDCAGAYKLELRGISLMERIETEDHTAIMGLPLLELSRDLVELGVEIPLA